MDADLKPKDITGQYLMAMACLSTIITWVLDNEDYVLNAWTEGGDYIHNIMFDDGFVYLTYENLNGESVDIEISRFNFMKWLKGVGGAEDE